ncbi:MAG: flagellar motor switch protein FliN [Bryobacter sp.]|nr:flagellar motor switch protein FliN [Bryobacter sp.]
MVEQAISDYLQSAAGAMESLSGAPCEPAKHPAAQTASSLTDEDKQVLWTASLGESSGLKILLACSLEQAEAIGNYILQAAGLDEQDSATLKSTYFEVLSQSLSAWTRKLTNLLGQLVEVQQSGETDAFDPSLTYYPVELSAGEQVFHANLGIDLRFFEQKTAAPVAAQEFTAPVAASAGYGAKPSGPFDLLLDVELPVSISFGRALVPLKEILKLSSGSIVELDRAVTEPVEVIVNNCVIARGEVVVVEGNYGIRIQQIVSRQDRLLSMK